ncbi:MAG: hypothetical protein ACRD3J_27350, partial [Thermoanaerobaculia bacterium]
MSNGDWVESSQATEWFLWSITDANGNTVAIRYSSSSTYKEVWRISDTARQTSVYFRDGLTPSFDATLDHIDFAVVGGQTLSYTFAVQTIDVIPPRGDSSGREPFPVPVLTAITPSLGNGYSMILQNLPAYENMSNITSGVLKRLTLPTRGAIGWTYQLTDNHYLAKGPRNPAVEHPSGVIARTTYDANGAEVATWSYRRVFSRPNYCERTCADGSTICYSGRSRQETVYITDPPNGASPVKTTINYFSNYEYVDDPDGDTCPLDGWVHAEHGLPFTRYKTDDAYPSSIKGRFLSSEIRTGFDATANAVVSWESTAQGQVPPSGSQEVRERETYVNYRLDAEASDFDANASLSSTATYYVNDFHCGVHADELCFTAVNYRRFDNYGHYRQQSSDGNLSGTGDFRTIFTNYNAAPTDSSWLLTPFTEQCTVDEAEVRTGEVSACSQLVPPIIDTQHPAPVIKQYCFDGNGFLTRQR